MSQSHPKVVIVIPTWNRSADLRECLSSLRQLDYANKQIIVVDNASTDDSVAMVQTEFTEVELLALPENLGATGASNAGFERALAYQADYVLRLDSDTTVDPALVTHLVAFAESTPQAGVLTAKILFYDQPEVIWSLGAQRSRWTLGAINTGMFERDADHQSPKEVDYAWSTGMLIRADFLRQAGGFDPAFKVYYEEIDFCLRVQSAGYSVWLVPQAKLWHKIESAKEGPLIAYNWNRSKMILFNKYGRGWRRLFLVGYAFAYALFRAMRPKPHAGNRGPLSSALQGLVAGLRWSMRSGNV